MEDKQELLLKLKNVLGKVKEVHFSDRQNYKLLFEIIDSVIEDFKQMVSEEGEDTENLIQIMNYCKIKMTFAKDLIWNDNVDEGVELAITTINYLIKTSTEENQ